MSELAQIVWKVSKKSNFKTTGPAQVGPLVSRPERGEFISPIRHLQLKAKNFESKAEFTVMYCFDISIYTQLSSNDGKVSLWILRNHPDKKTA